MASNITLTIRKRIYLLLLLIFITPIGAFSYDREAAASYADSFWGPDSTYWNSTDPNVCDPYKAYYGADCANFVSQCLIAGGYALSDGVDACGCHYDCFDLDMDLYFNIGAEYTTITWPSTDYPSNLEKGDVIIFGDISGDWYKHAVIVVSGTGANVLCNAHTENRYQRPITWWYGTGGNQWKRANFYHVPEIGIEEEIVVDVTSPLSGASYNIECPYPPSVPISWEVTGPAPITKIEIYFSADMGYTDEWIKTINNPSPSGTWIWETPKTTSSNCKIRIRAYDDGNYNDGFSDGTFTLRSMPPNGWGISIFSPIQSETWDGGTKKNIIWETYGGPTHGFEHIAWQKVYFSPDSLEPWTLINERESDWPGTFTYEWDVPDNIHSDKCAIKVEAFGWAKLNCYPWSGNRYTCYMVYPFRIKDVKPPEVTVISPHEFDNQCHKWRTGYPMLIEWKASDNVGITKQEVWLVETDGITEIQQIGAGDISPDDRSYTWTVDPGLAVGDYKIKVKAWDESDNLGHNASEIFTATDEWVFNPDFEDELKCWNVYRPHSEVSIIAYPDGHEGDYAAMLSPWGIYDPVGDWFGLYQRNIPCEPNMNYCLSWWAKAQIVPEYNVAVGIGVWDYADEFHNDYYMPNTTEWTHYYTLWNSREFNSLEINIFGTPDVHSSPISHAMFDNFKLINLFPGPVPVIFTLSASSQITGENNGARMVQGSDGMLHFAYTEDPETVPVEPETVIVTPPAKPETVIVVPPIPRPVYKVYYTYSLDYGENWSEPESLGLGYSPALALTSAQTPCIAFTHKDKLKYWRKGWTTHQEISVAAPYEIVTRGEPSLVVDGFDRAHLVCHEGYRKTYDGEGEAGILTTYYSFNALDLAELERTVLDSSVTRYFPAPVPPETAVAVVETVLAVSGSPSVGVLDGNIHVIWDQPQFKELFPIRYAVKVDGEWKEPELLSDTLEFSANPSINTFGNIVNLVWTQGKNVYHTAKYSNGKVLSPPVAVFPANTERCKTPFTSGNYLLWHQKVDDCCEIFQSQYKDFKWSEPANISQTGWADSRYPQVLYGRSDGSPAVYKIWTEGYDNSYWIRFEKETEAVPVPPEIVMKASAEPSPYTVKRDSFVYYGDEPYQQVDMGDELVYKVSGLLGSAEGWHWKIKFVMYHEGDEKWKENFDIDGIWDHNKWVESSEKFELTGIIPEACLKDSTIRITITPKSKDAKAVLSWFELYHYQSGGGGAMGAGDEVLSFKLHQNYPNPFSQVTSIRYQVPSKSRVSLKIYDVTGRLVKTLVDKEKKSGYYVVSWDAKSLTSGVYFVKFKGGDYKEAKKLILIR